MGKNFNFFCTNNIIITKFCLKRFYKPFDKAICVIKVPNKPSMLFFFKALGMTNKIIVDSIFIIIFFNVSLRRLELLRDGAPLTSVPIIYR